MRWLAAIVGVAACGRFGFDTVPASTGSDAGRDATSDVGDADPVLPAVVQFQSMYSMSSTTAELMTTSTRANDLLIVATADVHDASPLSTITDSAGDGFVPANATFSNSPAFGEVWFVASGIGGATSLTITDGALTDREVWILEISGAGHLDTANQVSDLSSGTTINAPSVTPTHLPAMIVSAALVTGGVETVAGGFTELPVLNGDDATFAIVSTAGSYGPTLTLNMGGTYGAATVAFDTP